MLLVSTPLNLILQQYWRHQRQNRILAVYHLRLLLPRTSFANTFLPLFLQKMSKPSPQPTEVKGTDKTDWVAVAAKLKQQLMQRRRQSESARPDDMGSSTDEPGHEPPAVQTRDTTIAGAQSIPGQSYQLPDDRGTDTEASQVNKPSALLITPDKSSADGSIQSTPSITQRLMETLRSPKESQNIVKEVNYTRGDIDAPPSANDHTSAKVEEKPDDGARGRVQRGDSGNSRKEAHATRSSAKSTVVPKDKPNTRSSAEEGEITGEPSAPLRRIPVHEATRQPVSCKKTLPTRVSTVTSIAPTDQHAKRRASGSLKATPDPKHRVQAAAGAGTPSSTSRSGGRQAYKSSSPPPPPPPPSAHHVYTRPSREQRPRSASPLASRLIEDREREVQSVDFRDPDLRDWLRLTGWYEPGFRERELARLRRLEEIEHEKAELRKQGEHDKAELKSELGEPASETRHPLLMPLAPPRRTEDVEPPEHGMLGRYPVTTGIKRERGEDSDGDADDGFPTKYHRTNHISRGSRARYHGYHSGREDSRHWQDREGIPILFPTTSLSYPQHDRSTLLSFCLQTLNDVLNSPIYAHNFPLPPVRVKSIPRWHRMPNHTALSHC